MRVFALLLFSFATLSALAQEIPGRAGRLAWFEGDVALYQDPERGWDEAYVNSPITSENSVWTDSGARAEVQVAAIALRLDQMSQLDVSRLDDEALDATLEQGALAIRIRHLRDPDVVRVSTPLASFRLRAPGRYRLDADPERGESRMTVFAGAASLETASGAVRIAAGQSVVVWGEDRPAYAFEDAYRTDFDRWAEARDERWIERRAPQFVSYEMTGYEDLDAWGDWREDPVYGVLWYPNRVESDWAPYRYGHWAYVRPWGWTWIDAQPWGYAPFHYGRWVHVRDRWAWCPGRRVERPVWAPALVAFIGGSGWSAGAASTGPAIGWYPLAPSEPYRPWYRASRTYVNQVNVTVVNVPERVAREHREWNRDRAATVVPRTAFVQQRPVAQARVRLPEQALRSAPSIATPAAALPTHTEVREAHRERRAPRPGPQATARAPGAGAAPSAAPATAAPNAPRFSTPRVAPQRATAGAKPPPAPAAGAQPLARGHPATPAATPPSAPAERAPGRTREERSALDRGERPSTEKQGERRPQPQPPRAAGEAQQREAQQREAQQREAQQREAQQRQTQQREAQQREARQRAAQEEQRAQAAREAQQHEAQQRAAQEQQRAQAAREAQQREAQQREAQQREAKQREAKQRETKQREDQQRAAQEQQRAQAAREAQQREAQQREAQQRAVQQRAAQQREAQQREAKQREAKQREDQQRAAQEQQRAQAAREAQQRQAQPRAAQEPPRAQGAREAPKGKGAEKEKDKEREKNDQGAPH